MPIIKYEVINPVKDSKRPFFDNKSGLFYIPVKAPYRYYVEVANTNMHTGGREYYILLSTTKFDEHCRLCSVDGYGRCRIKLRGEIKEYVVEETKYRGNINVIYLESENNYDVYMVE